MGCGASKESAYGVPTIVPKTDLSLANGQSNHQSDNRNGNALSKPVVPCIPASQRISQSVAFEIPLDGLTESRISEEDAPTSPATKLSLPKLLLSDKDLKEKLANTEARWKDLADAQEVRKRRKGDKPKLKSRKEPVSDLAALKIRLQEKEAAAKLNREREINKLQLKLARQEEHARKVLERKKALGGGSHDELRLSWGGEKGLAEPGLLGQDTQVSHSTLNSCQTDLDLKSLNINAANRMGSGRSNATDNTDTTDVIIGDRPSDPMKTSISADQNTHSAQTTPAL